MRPSPSRLIASRLHLPSNANQQRVKSRPETRRFRPAFVCPVSLQNLHPRFKSGRRLQLFIGNSTISLTAPLKPRAGVDPSGPKSAA